MPKSTPRPTNSTKNAIDIRLNECAMMSATAVVIDRPMASVISTARMIRGECNASHRMKITIRIVAMPLSSAPSCTVPNSSLAIGTGPVSRTRAWKFLSKDRSVAA